MISDIGDLNQKHTAYKFFFFVNAISGGAASKSLLKADLTKLCFKCPNLVHVWIWDISEGSTGKKPGFLKLKSETEKLKAEKIGNIVRGTSFIYVIAAGGDGTVMWMISELWAHNIDDTCVVVGVLPYGTGNDLANSLGWKNFTGIDFYNKHFTTLKRLIQAWLDAYVAWHDIWEITVELKDNGTLQKIDANTRHKKHVLLNEHKKLYSKMCNYFSMGVESRIGVGFERNRTKNQFFNKIRYGIEGFKKTFFKRTAKINTIILDLAEKISSERDESKLVFSTRNTEKTAPKLLPSACLIALNISSFAAGLDLWKPTNKSSLTTQPSFVLKAEQRLGDGLLEFISFKNGFSLGLERALRGQGRRIHQGAGPFLIQFASLSSTTRVYFQVDGEFFIMTSPKSISLSHSSRIKVLSASVVKRSLQFQLVEA